MTTIPPIAVIGIGCRLPGGVGSPEDLWELLRERRTGLSEIPPDRWNVDAFYHPDPEAREALNTRKGYFLKQNVAEFDARFFGFSTAEAEQTDPQQRLVLETTYEALENAGIPLETIKGSDTSVFISVFARDYDRMTWKDLPNVQKHAITGNGEAILAARISYVFDLRGGAMTIDTGCSGSLVAVHQACLSLRSGESRMAIAGGTELLLHPDQFVPWSYNGMANPDGQCFAFDSRGAGYGRGEGIGTVILKRLSDAIQDGDPIHSVILNSGINQDGKTAGILLPNAEAQSALVKHVYHSAGLDPANTLYVEAHGTGTQAGDKAEIHSIAEAISKEIPSRDLYVGSVKANIGHLEASSGIAGFIKAVMVLKKGQIPPQPNFEVEKQGLNLKARGIKIPTELTPLVPTGYAGPQRVSVSSYGYGGTNAHLILESPDTILGQEMSTRHSPVDLLHKGAANGHIEHRTNGVANGIIPRADKSQSTFLFPLTAPAEAVLKGLPSTVLKWIASGDRTPEDLRNLSYTLCCRRSLFRWRSAIVASTVPELQDALAAPPQRLRAATSTTLSFVFTGQGAQWHAMGRELISTSSIFQSSLEDCNAILKEYGCCWDLLDELQKDEQESRVGTGELAQPMTTAIQIALVDLFAMVGILPDRVVGHSSGEIAAAYAAGRLNRRAAIQIAFFRGQYSAQAKIANEVPGAMLAVAGGEKTVAPLLDIVSASGKGRLSVACVNSPDSVTVSGDATAIRELERMMEVEVRLQTRVLKVDTAYHSHHMEKVASAYLASLQGVEWIEKPASDVAFYSAVSGGIKTSNFGAEYWTENLVSQVQFSQAIEAMVSDFTKNGPTTKDQANVLIEIGPHPALQGPTRQILSQFPGLKYTYCPSLVRKKDAERAVLSTAARLVELGLPVKLERLVSLKGYDTHRRRCVSDLPPYPWDHSRQYWRESRLSRDHRLRQFPYHDLLGLLDVMSPLNEPRWRYHIGVERLPWLNHHVVERQVIWPGTGYICMAIEAMKQLIHLRSPERAVANLTMKDFEVAKAVIVPSEQFDGHNSEVEVQLILSSAKNASEDSGWESLRILSTLPDGSWAQNFSGMIRADLSSVVETGETEWVAGDSNTHVAQSLENLRRIRSQSTTQVNPQTLYSAMAAAGNEFGPSFMSLKEVNIGKGVGFAKMIVPDIGLYMPQSVYQPHTIHPAILDVPNHVMGILFYEECCKAAVMPTTTSEFSISTEILINPGDELLIACEIMPEGKRSAQGRTWLFKELDNGERMGLICATDSIRLRAVGEEVNNESDRPFSRKKNYRVAWSDHIDFLTESTYHKLVTSAYVNPEGRLSIGDQLKLNDQAASIYLERALTQPISRPKSAAPHLDIFHDWITDYLGSSRHRTLLEGIETDLDKDELLQRSVASGVEGQMLALVGKHLPAILRGELHSLDVMVEDDLLSRFYMDGPLEASNVQAAGFVRLLAHNKPHMTVLEIGAGTGGTTASILRSMDAYGESLLEKYCYTDISAGFFEHAQKKFAKWRRFLDLRTLDISRDPLDQGFEPHTYDLIVASNVIHATPRISDTLAHVRLLLRPGGRFVLVEMTRPTVAEGMIFGTLSGWWASEDGRKGSPLLTREGWHNALQKASFNGIEFASYDHVGPYPRTSVIISKAVDIEIRDEIDVKLPEVVVIEGPSGTKSAPFTTALISKLKGDGLHCSIEKWESLEVPVSNKDNKIFVILDHLENSILANPEDCLFEEIKRLFMTSRRVCWVTYHESTTADVTAMGGLAIGLARSIRRENEQMRLMTLNIEDAITESTLYDPSDSIAKIVSICLNPGPKTGMVDDSEFALRQGRLMVPRLHTDVEFNIWADRLNCDGRVEPGSFQGSDPLKLEVQVPGLLSSLCFTHDPAPTRPLADDEVQLDTRAFGVNFRDVFIALGQMPPGTPMAGEVAGIVTAVGSGEFVQRTYKVGDRVIGLLGVPYSNQTRVKGVHCQVLPDSVSLTDGASIYTVYLTAYYSLVEVARLEREQTVLIHSASGGVGQAAIQIAQLIGAEVIATVGSVEKRNFIAKEYGIPESHILSSRWSPSAMKREILRLTNNKGVNVVLNSLAGEVLAESWDCLAPLGVHIELGKTDIYKKSSLSMAPFDRSLTFAAVDLTVLLATIPMKMFTLLGRILQLFEQQKLTPVRPLNVFPIDHTESAFRLIAERKHMGKVILEVPRNQESLVNIVLQPPPVSKLSANGTYLIAGGLGDLGKRICQLLASLGAGHIVTLSRRSLDKASLHDVEDKVSKLGGKLHVIQCNITNKESISRAQEYCRASSLPPVRGIIHGGMVLKDRPFAGMSPEDWAAALGPKVTGTINLDESFWSPDLDFFITLSSVSGIAGRLAQANYSAGNCFQDAFVHARSGKTSTRYFTINIGAVTGSKSIASMTASTAQQELIQSASMTFTELFQVLQYAMDPSTAFYGCAQSVMGFDRLSLLSQDHLAAANPFFSMLPYMEEVSLNKSQESNPQRDPGNALRNVSSMNEAVQVISQAIGEKFVAFINRDLEDISFDMPLSSFGMDSLVSIELKNWMMRTFSVTLQASELNGPASILALSQTLAGRSTLLNPAVRNKSIPDEPAEEQNSARAEEPVKHSQGHGFACCRQFDRLPRQPIPDFDEAMQDHLENAGHFAANPEELESFRQILNQFTAHGSVGRRVYEQLAREARDPSIENWSADYILNSIHVNFRHGLPYSSFLLLQPDGKFQHSQAERAALLATAAYDSKEALERTGHLPDQWMFGTPQCNHQQEWMFDAVREPGLGCDISRKYSSNHLAALRNGRVFRIPLVENGVRVSYSRIKGALEQILQTTGDEKSWAGILTADNRDSWAKKRQDLLAFDIRNATFFKAIEEATLVVNLDNGAPSNLTEHLTHSMLHEGFNRWWDKAMQFVVMENGKSAVIFEHSRVDGVTPLGLLYHLRNAINSHKPSTTGEIESSESGASLVEEFQLFTNEDVESHIISLRNRYTNMLSQREFITHTTSEFGKTFLVSHSIPIKGVVESTIQLASRLYHGGWNPESWEGVSLAHYHKGRHDMIQTVSKVVDDFCSAATDDSIPASQRKALMLSAANDMSAGVKKAMDGKGYFRLFNIINAIWPKDKPRPDYFNHPISRRIESFTLVVTMLDAVAPGAAAMPANPGSMRIRYAVGDDDITFGVLGPKGKVREWNRCFDTAATVIKTLIVSG